MASGPSPAARGPGILAAAGATALSAALFFLGFGIAVVPVPLVAFLAPLPVLLLASRVGAGTAVSAAFLAFFLGSSNSWGFFTRSGDLPLPLGLTLCATLALSFALATGVFRGLLRRGRALPAALAAPAVWTGLAYLMQIANPMGLAGTMASSQAGVPVVLQISRVTGSWGVEYLVLLVPAVVAAVCAPGAAPAARRRTGAVGAAAVAAALGYGAAVLTAADAAGPTERVALVVHNHAAWGADMSTARGDELVASYVDEVAQLPDGVHTVVMPEGTFSATDASMPALTRPMREAARAHGVTIVVGLTHRDGGEKYQRAFVFPASGEAPDSYLKQRDMVSPAGDELVFLPGEGPRVGVAICNDLTAADPSRRYGAAGAGLLVVPASTEGDNGWQMARTAVVRGVENGFAVGWAPRAGQSTLADRYGRIHGEAASGGAGEFTTVTADVPAGAGATPYSKLGDWFAWLSLALAAGGVAAMRRGTERRMAASPPGAVGAASDPHASVAR